MTEVERPVAVRFDGIEKRYGRLPVLQGLSLDVPRGTVTALVGPNGSGKTTMLKILLGLVRPDAGSVTVYDADGQPVQGDRRAVLGYMPQALPFPENLTGREVLDLVRGVRPDAPVDLSLIETLGLEAVLDRPVRTFSGGTRQRLSAAVAFLFDPAVVVLDEPTAGLDPVSSAALKDKVIEACAAGTTFVLTSHVMSEVAEMAHQIAFLHGGRIVFGGTPAALVAHTGEVVLERAVAALMREMPLVP
ncbi:MAG: ABC transporter ATP-binding protein [Rhodothermales bacterium]|nr:ABC transporter ATP-binding protein [Rhodothermales bacterium]MCA0267734.1 ABC transporter ATP-binding protein [Bacteroidota bacterium]